MRAYCHGNQSRLQPTTLPPLHPLSPRSVPLALTLFAVPSHDSLYIRDILIRESLKKIPGIVSQVSIVRRDEYLGSLHFHKWKRSMLYRRFESPRVSFEQVDIRHSRRNTRQRNYYRVFRWQEGRTKDGRNKSMGDWRKERSASAV